MIRAIVIDDDLDTVEVFSEYLEMKSVQVVGKGYNGDEAVKLYQKWKPDVVFLDVMMPQYDGFYALEHIRRINSDVIIIMVTADLTIETENKLRALDASAIIYKPFDMEHVMKTVGNFVLKERPLC
ncbi:MAG: response regulator [Nitrososphaeraceae archaeon]